MSLGFDCYRCGFVVCIVLDVLYYCRLFCLLVCCLLNSVVIVGSLH